MNSKTTSQKLTQHKIAGQDQTEIDAWSRKRAIENAIEWIDGLISHGESGVRDLKHQRERLLDACKPTKEGERRICSPADHISFAVNDVQNINRNFRLDLATRIACDLAITEPKR